MDGITIKARNELEREKSFSPQEALKFLREKENFRFTSNGIIRAIKSRGISGDDKKLFLCLRSNL